MSVANFCCVPLMVRDSTTALGHRSGKWRMEAYNLGAIQKVPLREA